MFNKTIYKSETVVTPVTRVVEKTVTPDKVVEMYDQSKKEAEMKVVRSFVIEGNQLNGVVVQFSESYEQTKTFVITAFTLNGKEYTEKFALEDKFVFDAAGAFSLLKKHFTDVVSNKLIKDAEPLIKEVFVRKN